jgi:ceramide glucosyltransferase
VIILVLSLCTASLLYQLIALAACLKFRRRTADSPTSYFPPVSVLKPVHGCDLGVYEALRSHFKLSYPTFELLFGVRDRNDPVIAQIQSLCDLFPEVHARIVLTNTAASNRKVGQLVDLAAAARYGVHVVNDSDIRVEPDYLARVVAPLQHDAVGLVTCLYRASGHSLPTQFEALGIVTDFAPSTLVAPLFGVNKFAFGSTLAYRSNDLERVGGFKALGDYLADDYQLGKRLGDAGFQVWLSTVIVDTSLGGATWGDVWRHQLRWARTVRTSNLGGYVGSIITNTSFWAILACLAGFYKLGLLAIFVRLCTAFVAGVLTFQQSRVLGQLIFVPARDLWGAVIWLVGLVGKTITWRGQQFRLSRDGKLTPK